MSPGLVKNAKKRRPACTQIFATTKLFTLKSDDMCNKSKYTQNTTETNNKNNKTNKTLNVHPVSRDLLL